MSILTRYNYRGYDIELRGSSWWVVGLQMQFPTEIEVETYIDDLLD